MVDMPGEHSSNGAVAAAPWGSAGILPITWAYIAMMGRDGMKKATQVAILSANYMAHRLSTVFPVLYTGRFHAPTMSFPVPGTLMIEPTESESLYEMDRFCDAMLAIHAEITAVEDGSIDRHDNPLVNAPHVQRDLVEEWNHPYSRETAAFPAAAQWQSKFWPAVSRIDNVYGDRHLFCSCPMPEDWEDSGADG